MLSQPSLLKVLAQVNSVQFSNHTGYPTIRGQKLDGPGLWELVEGLQSNGLLSYTHLLTGAFHQCRQHLHAFYMPPTSTSVCEMCGVNFGLTSPVSTASLPHSTGSPAVHHPAVRAGYIGSASLLRTIVRLVELLRQQNPGLMYGACWQARCASQAAHCMRWLALQRANICTTHRQ